MSRFTCEQLLRFVLSIRSEDVTRPSHMSDMDVATTTSLPITRQPLPGLQSLPVPLSRVMSQDDVSDCTVLCTSEDPKYRSTPSTQFFHFSSEDLTCLVDIISTCDIDIRESLEDSAATTPAPDPSALDSVVVKPPGHSSNRSTA